MKMHRVPGPDERDLGDSDERTGTLAARTREAAERELPPIAIELVNLLGLDDSDERVWELVIVALKNAYVRGVDRGIVAVLQAAPRRP